MQYSTGNLYPRLRKVVCTAVHAPPYALLPTMCEGVDFSVCVDKKERVSEIAEEVKEGPKVGGLKQCAGIALWSSWMPT